MAALLWRRLWLASLVLALTASKEGLASPSPSRAHHHPYSSENHCSTLKGKDRPLLYANEPWVHAGKKATVTLLCELCVPEDVWWSKDGHMLSQSSRVRQMQHRHSHFMLRIKNVRERDFGLYYCGVNATNGVQAKERIEVSGVPYPAHFDLPSVWSESTFRLSWRVNSSTPIINYQLEFREIPQGDWVALNVPGDSRRHHDAYRGTDLQFDGLLTGSLGMAGKKNKAEDFIKEHTKSYTLRGLAKDTSYEARVRSRNIYGLSAESETLSFHTFDIQAKTLEPTPKDRRHNSRESSNQLLKTLEPASEADADGNGIDDQLEEELRVKATSQAPKPAWEIDDFASVSSDPETNEINASSEPLSTKERRQQGFAAYSGAGHVFPSVSQSISMMFLVLVASGLLR